MQKTETIDISQSVKNIFFKPTFSLASFIGVVVTCVCLMVFHSSDLERRISALLEAQRIIVADRMLAKEENKLLNYENKILRTNFEASMSLLDDQSKLNQRLFDLCGE